jgi:hypothetical protein
MRPYGMTAEMPMHSTTSTMMEYLHGILADSAAAQHNSTLKPMLAAMVHV